METLPDSRMCQGQFQKSIKIRLHEDNLSLLISADKITNLYAMNTTTYVKSIKQGKCKQILQKVKIQSRTNIECIICGNSNTTQIKQMPQLKKLAKKEAFITLKDHKSTFQGHPTCHLISTSKYEIGIISKHVFDEIKTPSLKDNQRLNGFTT